MNGEWFEERHEGGDVVVTCSAHFLVAVFADDSVSFTDSEEICRRDALGMTFEIHVLIPAAPKTDGKRPARDLFQIRLDAKAYEHAMLKLRPIATGPEMTLTDTRDGTTSQSGPFTIWMR